MSIKILKNNNFDIVLIRQTLQEETGPRFKAKIPGYDFIGITYHHIHGILTYARNDIEIVKLLPSSINDDIHRRDVEVGRMKAINIYKPPAAVCSSQNHSSSPHPIIDAEDMSRHHIICEYDTNKYNGQLPKEWAESCS